MKSIRNILATSIILLSFLSMNNAGHAQDGEAIFKANCGACHKPDKPSIGPALMGKKQAWIDAGEGDFLYEWVKNSPALIEAGNSKMAATAAEFSPIDMAPVAVEDADIDAIFAYIDAYTPPVEVVEEADVNYYEQDRALNDVDGWTPDTNRNVFYIQLMLMFLLIFAIFSVSKSIQSVANVKHRNGSNKMMGILALVGMMFVSNSASAFDIGMTNEHFFDITTSDNIIFLIINVILLGIFIHMKGILSNIVNSYYPEIAEAKIKAASVKKSKSKNILTQAVSIEEEGSILLDHDYDGIQELDNHLPPWWVWSFYASIAFAFYWLISHHVIDSTPDILTTYEMQMEEADLEVAAYLERMGDQVDETTVEMLFEESDLAEGAKIFKSVCATCHLNEGQGETGPNLTDEYWMYGGDIKDIFKIVKYGNKLGMPGQQDDLSPKGIQQVSSFVMSLPFVEGKEAQGTKIGAPAVQEEKSEEEIETSEDSLEDAIVEEAEAS